MCVKQRYELVGKFYDDASDMCIILGMGVLMGGGRWKETDAFFNDGLRFVFLVFFFDRSSRAIWILIHYYTFFLFF